MGVDMMWHINENIFSFNLKWYSICGFSYEWEIIPWFRKTRNVKLGVFSALFLCWFPPPPHLQYYLFVCISVWTPHAPKWERRISRVSSLPWWVLGIRLTWVWVWLGFVAGAFTPLVILPAFFKLEAVWSKSINQWF